MPVVYDNQILRPAPLVALNRTNVNKSDGTFSHFLYNIVLRGWIVNVDTDKDSPASQDYPSTMEGILAEINRINTLFSNHGKRLEITTPEIAGPNSLDFYPTIESVEIDQGVWVNLAQYTVTMRAVGDANDTSDGLESFSENWTITENENGTHTINHQLNAKGFLYYKEGGTNDPLDEARSWVYDRTYNTAVDGLFTPAVALTGNYGDVDLISNVGSTSANYWNKAVVESYDPTNYTYSLTETFVYNPTGKASEDWSATINYDQENTRRVHVSINGVVTGMADRASNKTLRLTNAKDYFFTSVEPNLFARLTPYIPTGYTLNPTAVTKQQSYEPPGVFRYSYTFAANYSTMIPGAVEENITISDNAPADIFASIGIPGRAAGPVIQYMGTTQSPKRSVVINARLAPSGTPVALASLRTQWLAKPNTNAIITALAPDTGKYYVESDTEEYSPISKQYSRSVTWVMNSSSNQGLPTIIHSI